MSNIRIKKSVGLSIIAIFLAISISIIPTNVSYAYVEFDVSGINVNLFYNYLLLSINGRFLLGYIRNHILSI